MTPPTPAMIEAGARAVARAQGFDPDEVVPMGMTSLPTMLRWQFYAPDARLCIEAAEAAAWVKPSAEWPGEGDWVQGPSVNSVYRSDVGSWWNDVGDCIDPPRLCRPIPQPPKET